VLQLGDDSDFGQRQVQRAVFYGIFDQWLNQHFRQQAPGRLGRHTGRMADSIAESHGRQFQKVLSKLDFCSNLPELPGRWPQTTLQDA
jgi:hypothetical protein